MADVRISTLATTFQGQFHHLTHITCKGLYKPQSLTHLVELGSKTHTIVYITSSSFLSFFQFLFFKFLDLVLSKRELKGEGRTFDSSLEDCNFYSFLMQFMVVSFLWILWLILVYVIKLNKQQTGMVSVGLSDTEFSGLAETSVGDDRLFLLNSFWKHRYCWCRSVDCQT